MPPHNTFEREPEALSCADRWCVGSVREPLDASEAQSSFPPSFVGVCREWEVECILEEEAHCVRQNVRALEWGCDEDVSYFDTCVCMRRVDVRYDARKGLRRHFPFSRIIHFRVLCLILDRKQRLRRAGVYSVLQELLQQGCRDKWAIRQPFECFWMVFECCDVYFRVFLELKGRRSSFWATRGTFVHGLPRTGSVLRGRLTVSGVRGSRMWTWTPTSALRS